MKTTVSSAVIIIFMLSSIMFGQGYHGGHTNPDSLELITVTGVIKIDSSTIHPFYYLYKDGDNSTGYILNFGPFWYEPDSSHAVRPTDNEVVTIYGGLSHNSMMNYDMLVVYEINGEFWRDPFEPLWNYLGGYMNMGRHHNSACNNPGLGWNHDSINTITVSGIAMVDTTFIFENFYLDTNNDSIPDYMLNFGPPWYESKSGALRPENGDQLVVKGGEIEMPLWDMLVVYEINGKAWRDSSNFSGHFGGGWMHRNMNQPQKFHSSFDDSDWVMVHPGWHNGGMHGGMMMPDSIFAEIFELFPNNLPNINSENALAGYQFNMLYPSGKQGMGPEFGCGGNMQFNNNIDIQLHYTDIQFREKDIDENTIKVKYYDDSKSSWIEIPGVVLDQSLNTLNFSNSSVNNLIVLTGEKSVTGILDDNGKTGIKDFKLFQNYPNPFNPTTTIVYQVPLSGFVSIIIYDLLGNEITTLVNDQKQPGKYEVNFDGNNLTSGVYFYTLRTGSFIQSRKLLLLK